MGSASEILKETVSSLSETEAARILDYIRGIRGGENGELNILLAGQPGMRPPITPHVPLPSIDPIHGTGVPASELLLRDRR